MLLDLYQYLVAKSCLLIIFFLAGNFSPDDIGEPILDVILEAGDLLYFPRGTIHQGRTLEDAHSMHITVSCCQKNTWADFFEKVLLM